MELETPRSWLRVQLEVRVDGTLVVGVSDDTGRSIAPLRTVTTAFGWPPPTLIPLFGYGEMVPALWPAELRTMLGEVADRLSRRQRSDQLLPSVPVFVDPPPSLGLGARPAVESLLRVIRPELAARWVVATTPPEQVAQSDITPFSLPLDVVGVGERGAEVLSSLEAPWFGPQTEVQSFRASAAWVETPTEAAARLAQGDVDVVVLGASDAEAWAAAAAGEGAPVRLAIVLGVGSGGVLDTLLAPVLWARSVIFVPGPADQDQVRVVGDLFAALSHDLPLHDVVAELRQQHPSRAPAQLVATPESVHDLRLTSAWEAVEGELAELSGVVGAGTELDYGAVLVDLPERQRDLAAELVRGVTSARGTLLAFRRETEGLNPLSQMRSDLQSAREALDQLSSQQQVPDEARSTEPRVVNLGLRRREGVLAAPYTDSFYVDRNRTLAAGGRYTLDVQIGAPWAHSLVADDSRRAELHLPGGRAGTEVEIVVFAEEGLVEGRDSETVLVPRRGPTRVVSFDITAPLQAGAAWLRVGVYHLGSLLQTLRLDLVVTVEEESRDEPVSVARLDHSATRDWANLRAVRPRALSLVLNNGSDGGHQLSVHGAGIKATVPVGRAASTDAVKKLRQILVQTVAPGADAADIVWQLAGVGEELRLWVAGRLGDGDAEALRRMAGTRDETVQVVRIDPDQAFPWALLYDWNLPEQLVGAPQPEVCFGTDAAGGDCGHQAGAEVVCVHGFWGIRHRVEEMLGETERRDIADPVRLGDPGVLVALGVSDAATTQLCTSLDTMLPSRVRELKQTEGLLDSLFDADRPGVVVVVGHNETRTLPGQPEGPRILVATSDHWFHGKSLDRRWNQVGRWSTPHSLVMLLSCGSAAPQATELTSYLSALRKVSAGAVIGTQCDVRTVIAVDFALGVLGLMTDAAAPQPLADAVRQTRRRIVIDGKDPRGFLFEAYGPAELTLAAT